MKSVSGDFTVNAGLYHCVELVIPKSGNVEIDSHSLVKTEMDSFLINITKHLNSQNTDNFLVPMCFALGDGSAAILRVRVMLLVCVPRRMETVLML